MVPSTHIVTSFDEDLTRLRDAVMEAGGLAEAQLGDAIRAIAERNAELAGTTRAADQEIDAREQAINQKVVSLLAMRQPMANDLREIVAALKIVSDLERIGDYAANAAKRAIVLCESQPVQPARSIPSMGALAQRILHDALNAYAHQDLDEALAVWRADEELDAVYTSVFRELLTYMMEDPRTITPCTHLLFIAKNFERIGDHATNIAETLHFAVTGQPMTGDRPKNDRSSFARVPPAQRGPAPSGEPSP